MEVVSNFQELRLLLVEDNDINREFVVQLLHGMGALVDQAVNGVEAIDKVRRESYDAILMDIQMPKMDGLEATRQIRQLSLSEEDRFATVPIIAMTAQTMTGVRKKSLDAGMNDYISKPIDPDIFSKTLLKWVDVSKSAGSTVLHDQSAVPVTDLPADLASMSSINTAEGLKRMAGNEKAYRKMLKRFREQFGGVTEELRKNLNAGDLPAAEQRCHAFKGVAGNIGAEQLFHYASDIDSKLKQNRAPTQGELLELDSLLQHVLEDIRTMHEDQEQNSSTSRTEVDRGDLLILLDELNKSIDVDLGTAEFILDELERSVMGTEWEEKVRLIVERADEFDIDAVKLLLLDLKKAIA